jgi:hypothetical protein
MASKGRRRALELANLRDDELPRLWGELMEEMRNRGIVHSGNSPIADIAERVAAEHLNAKSAARNTAGYDLVRGCRRIQVKGIRVTPGRRSSLSPIRSDAYDSVVVVVFDPVLRVNEILEIPKRLVRDCGRWSRHVNGQVLSLSKIRKHPKAHSIPVRPKWTK